MMRSDLVESHQQAGEERRAPRAVAAAAAAAVLASSVAGMPDAALANSETIASFAASGLVFKDAVEIVAVDDPQVEGVTIFLSQFTRSLTSKLAANPFAQPSQAALECVRNDPNVKVNIKGEIRGREGYEVFEERKNINPVFSKILRVRRIYHEKSNSLVYISYSTRIDTGDEQEGASAAQYKTSLCTIPLSADEAPPPAA